MGPVAGTAFRLLFFRARREELLGFDYRHLLFGLACTWVVGMGRWWDDPRAHLLQHLGVGSVVYVFVLSLLLWLLALPLRPDGWSYRHVLTFVSLTSPPALLYAIPVERFFPLETAAMLNVWFLAAVASWRVSLYVFFLRRFARLDGPCQAVLTLLPIALIIATLAVLNLERAVFQIMSGLGERTANDGAYTILVMLTALSFYGALPLIGSYLAMISGYRRRPGLPEQAPPDPEA